MSRISFRIALGVISFLFPFLLAADSADASLVASSSNYQDFPVHRGYYSFDYCDGSIIRNAAAPGERKDGGLSGDAFCSPDGLFGRAGYFDGSGDALTIPAFDTVDFEDLTVAAWIRPLSTSGERTVVAKWYAPDQWGLFVRNGRIYFDLAFPGGPWGTVESLSHPISSHTWTHVAGSYDGSFMRLYVDGVQVAWQAASGALQSSNRAVTIGNHPSWNAYHGFIDEVKIYDQAIGSQNIRLLATPPGAVGNRGFHLMPSQWACPGYEPGCNTSIADKFWQDLGYIHSVGNLNSVKTAIFSMRNTGGNRDFWLDRQNDKLTWLKAATGNHQTWILRAWPVAEDCPAGTSFYDCGWNFVHDLLVPLAHLRYTLKIEHIYLEIANEPNLPEEPFWDPDLHVNIGNYNDFFRGFFYGQMALAYTYPLTYAGLSPLCDGATGVCAADAWYQNAWVRDHIGQYADKVGVHVYWDHMDPGHASAAGNGRAVETGGMHYRRVKTILQDPAFPNHLTEPIGLQLTEFNLNKVNAGANHEQQADQICDWWLQAGIDATNGWWIEQATLFVTSTEDGSFESQYWLHESQLDEITGCQTFTTPTPGTGTGTKDPGHPTPIPDPDPTF